VEKAGTLMNFWSVLASETQFSEMVRILQATPCSEARYKQAAGTRILFMMNCWHTGIVMNSRFQTIQPVAIQRGL
jgi:hypothetical protein